MVDIVHPLRVDYPGFDPSQAKPLTAAAVSPVAQMALQKADYSTKYGRYPRATRNTHAFPSTPRRGGGWWPHFKRLTPKCLAVFTCLFRPQARLQRSGLNQPYPFTAPAVSPWIKWRCRKLNS